MLLKHVTFMTGNKLQHIKTTMDFEEKLINFINDICIPSILQVKFDGVTILCI